VKSTNHYDDERISKFCLLINKNLQKIEKQNKGKNKEKTENK